MTWFLRQMECTKSYKLEVTEMSLSKMGPRASNRNEKANSTDSNVLGRSGFEDSRMHQLRCLHV